MNAKEIDGSSLTEIIDNNNMKSEFGCAFHISLPVLPAT